MWFDKRCLLTYTHFVVVWIIEVKFGSAESFSKLDITICVCNLIGVSKWGIMLVFVWTVSDIFVELKKVDYTCNLLCEFGFWSCNWNKVYTILNGKWHNVKCFSFRVYPCDIKALNDLAPPYLKGCFQFCQRNYSLRSNGNLSLPKPRSDYCKRKFSYRGSMQFNNLPPHLKIPCSLSSFINKMHSFLPDFL